MKKKYILHTNVYSSHCPDSMSPPYSYRDNENDVL